MTKTEVKLPKFKGNPLVLLPESIPTANFLTGDFGKAFIEEYKGRAETDFGGEVLNVLNYNNDLVTGSNPFAVVLANQILAQEGLRTASPADLERVLQSQALTLRGTYEDTGLTLRTEGSPNEYLAGDLAKQLKARGMKVGKTAYVLPLNELTLRKDSDSPHGLAFDINEGAKVIDAPILNKGDTYFNSADVNMQTGIPSKTGQGERKIWTRDSGLSGFYLCDGLSLGSSIGGLAYSVANGRVVVVSAEGADAGQLKREYDKGKSERLAKLTRAQQILEQGSQKAYQEALRSLTE